MATKQAQTNNLKNQLASQGDNKPQQQNASPYRQLEGYLEKLKPQIIKSLPKTGVTAERLARIALTTVKKTPQLLTADKESLLGAIMESAQAGLEPNFMGSCYLIPYYDSKAKAHLVRFELGYRGMIEIMTRSGRVLKIVTNAVYEKDYFEHGYGINEKLDHIPSDEADRGEITHFYAYAPLDNGQMAYKVISAQQVNHIRDNYSKAFQRGGSNPWVTEYEAMGKKTAVKQLFKDMPIGDRESADILESDETVKRTFDGERERVEIDAYEIPAEEEQQQSLQEQPPEAQ